MTDPQTPEVPGTDVPAAAVPGPGVPAAVVPGPEKRAGRADKPARTARARGLLAAGGRATLALGAAAAAVALAAAVLLVPSPALSPEPLAVTVVPERADQSLVCAGGALGLTRGEDPQLAVVAQPQRRSAGAGLIESGITDSDALDGGAVVVTLPREAPAAVPAASESVRPATSDVAGLAAAECLTPRRTAWLVGGATTTGRTTWIVLSNGGSVNATVDLRIFTENGPVDAPGTSGILVAAGTQRVLPLSGIIVGAESPVIAVTSSGGSVAATLQHTVVRGLDADGISIVTPLDAAATRHVIPALPVIGGQLVLERSIGDNEADAFTALRMLTPGTAPAQVTVTLVPQSGGTGLALTVALEPSTVFDLPFTDLADGDYSVVVESTEPVVVAARTTAAGTAALDLEWFSPAPAIAAGTEVLAAIAPAGVAARLHLFAPDGDAEVTIDGRTVVVASGSAVILESAANVGVVLSTTATLHASVSYRGDGELAGTRILPPPEAARPVTVLPY